MEKQKKEEKENEINVEYWRKRFLAIKKKAPKGHILRHLIRADNYYDSIQGMQDYGNVSRGKAGLAKTRRAVLILETATVAKKKKAKSNNLLKRQKLEL